MYPTIPSKRGTASLFCVIHVKLYVNGHAKYHCFFLPIEGCPRIEAVNNQYGPCQGYVLNFCFSSLL